MVKCHVDTLNWYGNPQGNKRSAGFTIEERESFEKNFLSEGFVDTFRKQHPDVVGYTYWGYRHGGRKTNRGIVDSCILMVLTLHLADWLE